MVSKKIGVSACFILGIASWFLGWIIWEDQALWTQLSESVFQNLLLMFMGFCFVAGVGLMLPIRKDSQHCSDSELKQKAESCREIQAQLREINEKVSGLDVYRKIMQKREQSTETVQKTQELDFSSPPRTSTSEPPTQPQPTSPSANSVSNEKQTKAEGRPSQISKSINESKSGQEAH